MWKESVFGNGQDHHCQQYKTSLRDHGKVNEQLMKKLQLVLKKLQLVSVGCGHDI